ncbi:Dbl homology domain-containing protein, partial [Ramicandelaber brevisporus]
MMAKRRNIAQEILVSEQAYVAGLQVIDRVFYRPLNESLKTYSPILTSKTIKDIFANFSTILSINTDSNGNNNGNNGNRGWNPATSCLGDIFLETAPFLKMYSLYIKNFQGALSVISQQMNANTNFTRFLQSASLHRECRNLSFQHHLILPVQRIPRYKLLLEKLLANTPVTHRDYSLVCSALRVIMEVADFVNDTVRQHEMFISILDIQRYLTGFPEQLLVPGRSFIKRGPVQKICRKNHQPREFFLFSDILIYASPRRFDEMFVFHRKLMLEYVSVVDIADGVRGGPGGTGIKNRFQIYSREKSFAVYTETAREKQMWINTLRQTIDELTSSLQSLRVGMGRVYVENYSAPVWVPDDQAVRCMICEREFTFFRRKHHCRCCGGIACADCS